MSASRAPWEPPAAYPPPRAKEPDERFAAQGSRPSRRGLCTPLQRPRTPALRRNLQLTACGALCYRPPMDRVGAPPLPPGAEQAWQGAHTLYCSVHCSVQRHSKACRLPRAGRSLRSQTNISRRVKRTPADAFLSRTQGDWRGISRHYVSTRTPTQVASHAQKHFIRQCGSTKRKRRCSLFDITGEVPQDSVRIRRQSPLPPPPPRDRST